MTNITSFTIIALTVLLLFLFFKFLFKKSSVEFQTFMTFITMVVIGLIFVTLDIEVVSTDLVHFSVSLLAIYAYFSIQNKREENKPKEVRKNDKLAKKIYKNRSKIFERVDERNGLEDYFYLKVEYEKGNVMSDKFQSKYKNFYNMYVFGFTDEFFEKYFELLSNGETDIRKVLTELSKIKNKKGKKSVQLAFASKLVHTVDSEMPLYNSTVGDLFNLSIPKGSIEKKINSSMEIYQKLKSHHGSLIARDSTQKAMTEFRSERNFKEGILSDMKLIDSFIKAYMDL